MNRRFREFCTLRTCLKPFKNLTKMPFPSKSWVGMVNDAELENRKRLLNAYLKQLTIRQALPAVVQQSLIDFLELKNARIDRLPT